MLIQTAEIQVLHLNITVIIKILLIGIVTTIPEQLRMLGSFILVLSITNTCSLVT